MKRGVALDPLSRINRESLGVAYIKASLHFARQKAKINDHEKSPRYREFMKEAVEMGEADLQDMTLGRPYLLVRQAIFEWIGGYEKEGDLLLAEVMKNDNEDGRLSYFAYLISIAYSAPPPLISRLENDVKAIFTAMTPASAAALTDVFRYVKLIDPSKFWLQKEAKRLNACALKAADQPCKPQDAEKIIRYAFDERWPDRALLHRYIKKMLKLDPNSPLFLYFLYLYDRNKGFVNPPTEKDLKRLKDIQSIAVERNERLLINQLGKEIRQLEEFLSSPYRDDDDDDDDDEEYFGGGRGNRKAGEFSGLTDELIEELDRILDPRGKSSSRRKKTRVDTSQASLFDDSEILF